MSVVTRLRLAQAPDRPSELVRKIRQCLAAGVGLDIHERPGLGRTPDTLQAGDVITLEPGCYRQGYGGCRLEDLVLVTEQGCETLTDFPYDL